MRVMPSFASFACSALPAPRMKPTGLSRRNDFGFGAADHGKAARLVEIGGELGEKFVVAEARPKP